MNAEEDSTEVRQRNEIQALQVIVKIINYNFLIINLFISRLFTQAILFQLVPQILRDGILPNSYYF